MKESLKEVKTKKCTLCNPIHTKFKTKHTDLCSWKSGQWLSLGALVTEKEDEDVSLGVDNVLHLDLGDGYISKNC